MISLYAKGLTSGEIHPRSSYGIEGQRFESSRARPESNRWSVSPS
jgi:hypothetical protein